MISQHRSSFAVTVCVCLIAVGAAVRLIQAQEGSQQQNQPLQGFDKTIADYASTLLNEGRRIFRSDTFGSEDFWGGKLRLHEAIAGAANGGTGPGLSPRQAVALGLKVDAAVLPGSLVADVRAGRVDLDSPATTIALLKLNAVVGVNRPICAHFGHAVSFRTSARILMRRLESRSRRRRG
jgi:hypothetical protein